MKREQFGIGIAFLGGIFLANLFGKELLLTYGILNEYYLSRYMADYVDGNRLLCSVIFERGKAALFLFLLGKTVNGRIFSALVQWTMAAVFGFLMVVSIVNLGVRGVAVCLGALFPQWLFYLAALFLYVQSRKRKMPGEFRQMGYQGSVKERWSGVVLSALFLLLGIAESYLNPVLLRYLLQML